MKQINRYLSNKIKNSFFIKATDETIKQIVKDELDRLGHDADLNHIDVSEVTNMNNLFYCGNGNGILSDKYEDLNPDISKWNVANVTQMKYMFGYCKDFDCDISGWNVGNCKYFVGTFEQCKKFNSDLSQWDTHNAKRLFGTFYYCEVFNSNISQWDVSNVIDMDNLFEGCEKFNQNLSQWDVSKVISHEHMFTDCPIREEFKPRFK